MKRRRRLPMEKVRTWREVGSSELQQWQALGRNIVLIDPFPLEQYERRHIPLKDAVYQVDTEMSEIEWAGRNPNVKHNGTIKLSNGQITMRDGEGGGSFEIDMTSIKNKNLEGDPLQPVLVTHLMSDDFFFVKMFPKATFTIRSAKAVDEPTWSSPNFSVTGVFELRGIGREIHFLATVNSMEDRGISAEAHFDLDRTQWNIIYGSSRFFRHLGMHLVYDLISLDLRIVARPV
jgi:polyisoprenoid-binding protein YceI